MSNHMVQIAVDSINPNPDNPQKNLDVEDLEKLVQSFREENRAIRTAFEAELEKIAELAKAKASVCSGCDIPRGVLIYLAAQVLANVPNSYDRKITKYKYVKNKFGWDDAMFKSSGAYQVLYVDWETCLARLESLSEHQLWEIIFEWPAVAAGITGARNWILEQGLELKENSNSIGVCRVCGCADEESGL